MSVRPRFEMTFSPGDGYARSPIDFATRENNFPMPAQAWMALERERGLSRDVLRQAGFRVRRITKQLPLDLTPPTPPQTPKPSGLRRMLSWIRPGKGY